MGKINKILINILLIGVMIISINVNSFAADQTDYSDGASLLQQMTNDTKSFLAAGKNGVEADNIEIDKMAGNFKGLGQILTMIGVGVLVAVTTYMGIKYLTSGPEAQAKLKTQLIGIVVSGCVIFGAYYIWKLVVNIASGL